MDTYNWVSGPGVFIGSCILSGSLLSVVEIEGGTQVNYLAINIIRIRTVVFEFCYRPFGSLLDSIVPLYANPKSSTLRQLLYTSFVGEADKKSSPYADPDQNEQFFLKCAIKRSFPE